MTLPSTPRRAGPFYGDGSATQFPFSFKTYTREDIQFVVTPADGDPGVLVLDADYTVTLNTDQENNPGGYVSYPISGSPLPVGDTAAIAGNLAYGQPTDLPDGGAYRARTVETMGDRLGMLIQQLRETLDRTLVFPLTDGVTPILPPAELRAGRVLGFDDDGQFIGLLPAPGDATGLAIDLANTSSGTKGAGMVGFNPALSYPVGTVGNLLVNLPIFSVLQYGAVGDGVANDRAAIQAANDAVAAAGGGRLYFPAGTYLINSQINLSSNIEVYGDGPASVIKQGNAGISSFYIGPGKRGVMVRDLKILGTLVSGAAYTGGVFCDGASYCAVVNVEMQGLTWAGVYLNNSQYCLVDGCRFSGWLGSVQDRAEICIYRDSNYNVIRGNFCNANAYHGILIQDPYTPSYPTGNIIVGNQIGEHGANGIALYKTSAYDDMTVIANNVVRDIAGTELGGMSGSGIFVQSGGGTVVVGNTVSNCCRFTTGFDTQAVAAITVGVGIYGAGTTAQISVVGNHVFAQRGPGIYANTSDRTILIEGNTIQSTGVANVRGEALLVVNCVHVKVHNNSIYHANPNYQALRITSSGADFSYHQCTNNTVFFTGAGGIIFNQAGGGTSTNCLISGNTAWTSGSGIAYTLEACNQLRFQGNHGDSNGVVFTLTNCLGTRMSGNRLTSPSVGYSIIFTGTNTGSLCDESNSLSGLIENDPGNGTIISRYGNAAPASSGLWNVGDRVIQSVPVVGNPNGWRCTVAGNPGTWVSEGNLGGGGGGGGSSGATMETIFVNSLCDLYAPNDPTVGPPVGMTTPGSAVRENTIYYPGNPIKRSVSIISGGTANGNAATITLQSNWEGGPLSVGLAIRSFSATRRMVAHWFDGTTRQLIGQNATNNAWDWIMGTFTPAPGSTVVIELSIWDGTTRYAGFQGFLGGVNLVQGSVPPLTVENSLGRLNYTAFATVNPSTTPDRTNMFWYNTATGDTWWAKGSTAPGAADWKQIA